MPRAQSRAWWDVFAETPAATENGAGSRPPGLGPHTTVPRARKKRQKALRTPIHDTFLLKDRPVSTKSEAQSAGALPAWTATAMYTFAHHASPFCDSRHFWWLCSAAPKAAQTGQQRSEGCGKRGGNGLRDRGVSDLPAADGVQSLVELKLRPP